MIQSDREFKMEHIGLLIKPTHRCNMDCSYCYDKVNRVNISNDMTMETVEKMANMASRTARNASWIWHGGEALLMGKEWLTEANKIVRKYFEGNDRNVKISTQSNGILLDDDMITFLKSENMSVGASYDGAVHDITRGVNSDLVIENLKNAKSRDFGIGLISVMDVNGIDKIMETVDIFRSLDIKGLTFNWVHPKEFMDSSTKYIGSVEHYTEKFKEFFDWLLWNQEGFTERTCDAIIRGIFRNKEVICSFRGCTGSWLGIDPNGTFFPCDRYYPEDYKLGNINEDYDYETDYLTDVFFHPNFIKLKYEVSQRRLYCLENCEFAENCGSGCNATSVLMHGTAAKVNEQYCYTYIEMMKHVFNRIKDLSDEDMSKLNPKINSLLCDLGYVSLSEIRQSVKEHYLERGI